jgi:hypothetical protein
MRVLGITAVMIGIGLVWLGISAAQDSTPTPTPAPFGPIALVTPSASPTPFGAEDARPGICAAPFQTDWQPHVIAPGDRLGTLLVGRLTLTVAQAASLNCLEDPTALPIGAVIWLPPLSGLQPLERITDPSPERTEYVITRLQASATDIQHTQTVTISWEGIGSAAYFYACPTAEGACPRPVSAAALAVSGQVTLGSFYYPGTYRYRLLMTDGTAGTERDVMVTVRCAAAALGQYTGEAPCAALPAQTEYVVTQSFERGTMLWFPESSLIWVLLPDGRVLLEADPYAEGDAPLTVTAPDGLLVPERGFGAVWEALGLVDTLGWATAVESGTQIDFQPASRASYTTYLRWPDGQILAVTLVPTQPVGYWVALA